MKGVNLLELVRKRHDGDGWLVFTELGNKPGTYADRYADAFALGVWASKKYEAHLFEFKISREDLKRELRDPAKVDGVGRYATYWWLVIPDPNLIRDLVIPETWGILVPTVRGGSTMLTAFRKSPRHTPSKFDAMFAIALVRNMAKRYVSNADHERVRRDLEAAREARDIPPPPTIQEKDFEIGRLQRRIKDLEDGIKEFQEATGVDLLSHAHHSYDFRHMGRAFEIARKLQRSIVEGDFGEHVGKLSTAAQTMENAAAELAEGAVALRALMPPVDKANCPYMRGWMHRCTCGQHPLSEAERRLAANARVVDAGTDSPPPSNDHEGGGIDRRSAGAPVEDAGVQLRDLGDQVSHG